MDPTVDDVVVVEPVVDKVPPVFTPGWANVCQMLLLWRWWRWWWEEANLVETIHDLGHLLLSHTRILH